MINNDRIVPIQKCDFLSMIGIILDIAQVTYNGLAASTIEGDFNVAGTGNVGTFLANQPVQTLDFASGVTDAVVYFVAAYNFAGISINGTAVDSDDVQHDGITLYKATLGSGDVTVVAVTPEVPEAEE